MALEHFLISGRVQGVGYRAWCKSYAEKLGLSGWVRNLTDKRVELLIFDQDADSLALLKAALSKGPVFASVKSVECQYLEQGSATEELLTPSAGFAILRTSITALQHSLKSQETQ